MRRLLGFGLIVGVLVAGGAQWAGADPATSNIVVTQVPAAVQPACQPASAHGATGAVSGSSSTWTLTIKAKAPICEPVTAAIYAMPNNIFWPWPQKKVEATTFTVPAGTTTVTFNKTCGALQFDVVTGATPDSIQPTTGPMHGPLLFTVSPWSATQNFGAPCTGTTTTTVNGATTSTSGVAATTIVQSTSTSTSTSTSSTTSSTVAVLGTTTVPGATSTTPTSVLGATTIVGTSSTVTPVSVKPATETRTGTSPAAGGLATTGFAGGILVVIGLVMLAVGVLAQRISAIRQR